MSDQVDNIFGPTKDVETFGDTDVVRTYGEAAAIGWFEIPWVSVEFHEGEVVSVITTYTSEFGKPVSRPSQGR